MEQQILQSMLFPSQFGAAAVAAASNGLHRDQQQVKFFFCFQNTNIYSLKHVSTTSKYLFMSFFQIIDAQ
jgi:hypothetical protein